MCPLDPAGATLTQTPSHHQPSPPRLYLLFAHIAIVLPGPQHQGVFPARQPALRAGALHLSPPFVILILPNDSHIFQGLL